MRFEDLNAWLEARELVREVYSLTKEKPLDRDFGLSGQIQRAAVSVMTNIAEGFERTGKAEKLNFYNIARASCGETRSLLYVVQDNYPHQQKEAAKLRIQAEAVGRLVTGLIASTRRRPPTQ